MSAASSVATNPVAGGPVAADAATANPLVSIVTPCYNGEAYLARYFACILAQTYVPLEVIMVDDGSTDRTPAVIEAHRARLARAGIALTHLRQDHAGQAAAINRALPAVIGTYVTWPDSDDLMRPDNIARKVAYLECHPEAGFVCCQVANVREGPLEDVLSVTAVPDTSNPWLFDRLIRDRGAYCLDIAYLARTSALFDALGGRRIVESPAGQNFQLLLPLAYRYPCGFIDEPLAAYVARAESHSRSFTTVEQRIQRTYDFEVLLHEVLSSLQMSAADRETYERYVDRKFLPRRLQLALESGDRALFFRTKEQLDAAEGRRASHELAALAVRLGMARPCWAALQLLTRGRSKAARFVKTIAGRLGAASDDAGQPARWPITTGAAEQPVRQPTPSKPSGKEQHP